MGKDLQLWSNIFGWTYTITWGISFYGQVWEVWKLKSCEGLTLDYVLLNEIGYFMYSIYSSFGYFDPENSGISNVDIQDLIFTYHGLLMNSVLVAMCFYYPRGKNKFNLWAKLLSLILILYSIIYALLTNVTHAFDPPNALSTLNLLGYNKLIITLVKYSPQVYWNFKRKSTLGWNIFNVICDFSGGFFSFAQNTVDALNGNTDFIGGVNTAKFLLGIITMVYDTFFIIQHYCLYRKNTLKEYQEQLKLRGQENQKSDLYDIKITSQNGESEYIQSSHNSNPRQISNKLHRQSINHNRNSKDVYVKLENENDTRRTQ